MSTIDLAYNPEHHARSKHIDRRHFLYGSGPNRSNSRSLLCRASRTWRTSLPGLCPKELGSAITPTQRGCAAQTPGDGGRRPLADACLSLLAMAGFYSCYTTVPAWLAATGAFALLGLTAGRCCRQHIA
eukprot:6186872-Pleurochrysis_carterae.AAC.1